MASYTFTHIFYKKKVSQPTYLPTYLPTKQVDGFPTYLFTCTYQPRYMTCLLTYLPTYLSKWPTQPSLSSLLGLFSQDLVQWLLSLPSLACLALPIYVIIAYSPINELGHFELQYQKCHVSSISFVYNYKSNLIVSH